MMALIVVTDGLSQPQSWGFHSEELAAEVWTKGDCGRRCCHSVCSCAIIGWVTTQWSEVKEALLRLSSMAGIVKNSIIDICHHKNVLNNLIGKASDRQSDSSDLRFFQPRLAVWNNVEYGTRIDQKCIRICCFYIHTKQLKIDRQKNLQSSNMESETCAILRSSLNFIFHFDFHACHLRGP